MEEGARDKINVTAVEELSKLMSTKVDANK